MEIKSNLAVQVHTVQEWIAVVRLFQRNGYNWKSENLNPTTREHYLMEGYPDGAYLFTRIRDGKKFIMHSSTIHTYLNPNPDYHTTLVTLADLFGEEHAILLSF